MKLTKQIIIDSILDRLVWEDVVENVISYVDRDITDEEGNFISEVLMELEKIIKK